MHPRTENGQQKGERGLFSDQTYRVVSVGGSSESVHISSRLQGLALGYLAEDHLAEVITRRQRLMKHRHSEREKRLRLDQLLVIVALSVAGQAIACYLLT
jgi:hypothetical protein